MASSKATFINILIDEFRSLLARRKPRKMIITAATYLIILIYFSSLVNEMESICLGSFIYLNYFQFLSLFCAILFYWIETSTPTSPKFSFGYARFEVLATFSLFTYSIFNSLMNIKEGFEHYVHHADSRSLPHPHHPILLTTATVSFAFQIFITYGLENPSLQHVQDNANSSLFQRELGSLLSMFSINGSSGPNPFTLMSILSLISVAVSDLLVLFGYSFQTADIVGASMINLIIVITVLPLTHYVGAILLQATPDHLSAKLDNIRSELTTMEGVLEVKNEHFWSSGFNQIAGSLQVRVSRNTNEQKVLAMIVLKLFPVVPKCSVQVTKDEWSMTNNSKKQINYTISAKHIENLKEFSIPSFQSQVQFGDESSMSNQKSKLNSLIKSKSINQKQSVNRLTTYSAIKKQ